MHKHLDREHGGPDSECRVTNGHLYTQLCRHGGCRNIFSHTQSPRTSHRPRNHTDTGDELEHSHLYHDIPNCQGLELGDTGLVIPVPINIHL